MLDIRALLQKYQIEFVDRGPNTSKGHVNIRCPWCGGLDKSHHLAVREDTGQYYCYRQPNHRGNIVAYLLAKLGIPYQEYVGQKPKVSESYYVEEEKDYSAAKYFEPAEENARALDYLRERLFTNPAATCKQFNLKVSKQGEWAARLIIPLTMGWTGRAMRPDLEPRYKAYTSSSGFFYYQHGSDSVIIVEGAIDAMKIAIASSQFDVIAKCRMESSLAIIAFITAKNYQSIYNAPDGNVPFSTAFTEYKTLKSHFYSLGSKVNWLKMPTGIKDFGQLVESDVRKLLPAA